MINDNYQLRYLPLFFDDVNSVTSYIKNELLNPKAANDMIDAIEDAILERLPVCESYEPLHSIHFSQKITLKRGLIREKRH